MASLYEKWNLRKQWMGLTYSEENHSEKGQLMNLIENSTIESVQDRLFKYISKLEDEVINRGNKIEELEERWKYNTEDGVRLE